MAARSIAIFGSGPGIGNHVAAKFAASGFNHVILLARNQSRLQEDANYIKSKVPDTKVSTVPLDLSNLSAVTKALDDIDAIAPKLEVIFYNAAVIKSNPVLEVPTEEIEKDFRVTTTSLYLVAQHYVPRLTSLRSTSASAKPAILVTNSHLPWAPIPQLLSLSIAKASQQNLVKSLAAAFQEVHFGLVHVEGTVTPEEKDRNPVNISEVTYALWEKGSGLEAHIK
ncbi:NAD(P)-binding protein [Polyplosphaeria fusca]|uniref:NAD(P)-binding protein n=1 Tax=Polyplosphaeria fusca TaxID=682080 RepID=A0A9P4R7J7_9PLEO|nr:NAD(P)-binding protein [Polyplosphaeria fusca]